MWRLLSGAGLFLAVCVCAFFPFCYLLRLGDDLWPGPQHVLHETHVAIHGHGMTCSACDMFIGCSCHAMFMTSSCHVMFVTITCS